MIEKILDIIKAIRDWCISTFQPIGNYVTDIELKKKGYLTSVPAATWMTVGGVKPDGTTITIDDDGTIHAVTAGGVQNGALELIADQTIAVPLTLVNQDDISEEEITWNQES